MPKCTNDKTKNYTGNEPSPKGLGFCASAEEVGAIMSGKDGSNWIVTQTKTCKKWVKVKNETTITEPKTKPKPKTESLDFDNMEEDCYTYSYIPDVDENELTDERGYEEKFGGSKPFFIEGESWPLLNEESNMYFLCQFKDPRKEDNILFRVFYSIEEDEEDSEEDLEENLREKNYATFKFFPIELSEENLKKQIVLESPDFKTPYNKGYQIKSWNPLKELRHVSYIINKYSLKFEEKYFNEYFTSKYLPSKETKLGGTHILMGTLGNILGKDNFLQLNKSSSKYLPSSLKCYGLELLYWNK